MYITYELVAVNCNQCGQIARLLFNAWPFTTMTKFLQEDKNAKVGAKVNQIQNKPSKKVNLRLLKFCQSGKISPNQVTLIVSAF